ncbi:hypothetical protein WJX72_002343 [[Myrmecia] bisecta]|uniref:VOC domain-containing protein n=1 Tax=[Myrmecia] bisecta TaxID=41462 RepID=A0AAW1R5D1_9CHLO
MVADIVSSTGQDVGGIVHFEHLNLEVPDLEQARIFYSEGLGLTLDPDTMGTQRGGLGVVWYNIGRQQFHIMKSNKGQNMPGNIHIVLPRLDLVHKQLEGLRGYFKGTKFNITAADGANGGLTIHLTDPWGQGFVVHNSDEDFPYERGISRIALHCPPDNIAALAHFYRTVFQARVEEAQDGSVKVYLGPGIRLTIFPDPSLDSSRDSLLSLYDGWHIAIYVAPYSHVFNSINDMNANYLDHTFADKSPTLPTALQNRQFRFQDIFELPGGARASHAAHAVPSTSGASLAEDAPAVNGSANSSTAVNGQKHGRLLYRFQHEVRSMHHPRFLHPLYNRPPGAEPFVPNQNTTY